MICSGCELDLDIGQFRVRGDRGGKRHTRCHACINTTTIRSAQLRRRRDPEGAVDRDREYNVRRYGITQSEFTMMADSQGWLCAICKSDVSGVATNSKRKAHIDHDHTSHQVKGILCSTCNRAIGLLRDSAEVCEAAAAYLRLSTVR